MVRVGLTEVTFKQRPESSEGTSHTASEERAKAVVVVLGTARKSAG